MVFHYIFISMAQNDMMWGNGLFYDPFFWIACDGINADHNPESIIYVKVLRCIRSWGGHWARAPFTRSDVSVLINNAIALRLSWNFSSSIHIHVWKGNNIKWTSKPGIAYFPYTWLHRQHTWCFQYAVHVVPWQFIL